MPLTGKEGPGACRRDLRHPAAWLRRLGELTLIAAAAAGVALPWQGIHSLLGYSPRFLAVILAAVGAVLIAFSIGIRASYRRHFS